MSRVVPRWAALLPGAVAAIAGLALLAQRPPLLAALGAELVAAAFWMWARLGDDRREQLARWAWLRRPAMALWLAAALTLALPPVAAPPAAPHAGAPAVRVFGPRLAAAVPRLEGASTAPRDPLAPLRALAAIAVLWAGLELLGAVPLSRPFPDLTGPLPGAGVWLPAAVPAAGFLLLWRQAPLWTGTPWLREVAELALLVAAALAVVRAYSRRSWSASLRWLAVADSALAGLVVALGAVPPPVALALWAAAAGGRLVALAGEVRGASARRGARLTATWRVAGWLALASLAWPLLLAAGFAGGRFRPVTFVLAALPVVLAARLSVRRLVEAPERRAMGRPDPWRLASFAGAIAAGALGPLALVLAWRAGLRTAWPAALAAAAPALLGAWPAGAMPAEPPAVLRVPIAAGATARDAALSAFRVFVGAERRFAALLAGLAGGLLAPVRDLHTGDPQEYLLFLVGVAVLALLLPLLR